MKERKVLTTKNIAVIGMLGGVAGVLMMFEIPLAFIAPPFYGLDFSEIPVLIGTFALGPVAGVLIELVKIFVKLLFKPTTTGFVGEFANFAIGCSLLLPAGVIYQKKKTRNGAITGMLAGTATMSVVGAAVNALVMLPFYSKVMPLDQIIAAGAAIQPAVNSIWSFAIICVAPFNFLKGLVTSIVTALIYKSISKEIHRIGKNG